MPTAPSREKIIARFLSGADRLAAAVSGLSDASLDLAAAPGEWTIRQIVHHVADDGDAWSMALKKAFATPGAPVRFEGFPGNDAWAKAAAFDRRGIQTPLALIKAHRQAMAELGHDFINGWDDRFVVILDGQGNETARLTAEQIFTMLAEHLLEHVKVIEGIKRFHKL
jgi:uncharacterized damage-inducible protein DinB